MLRKKWYFFKEYLCQCWNLSLRAFVKVLLSEWEKCGLFNVGHLIVYLGDMCFFYLGKRIQFRQFIFLYQELVPFNRLQNMRMVRVGYVFLYMYACFLYVNIYNYMTMYVTLPDLYNLYFQPKKLMVLSDEHEFGPQWN